MKSLGLAQVISDICQPGIFNQWTCPHVIEIYRLYCWQDTLGGLLHRWTHVDIRKTFPTQVLSFVLFYFDFG